MKTRGPEFNAGHDRLQRSPWALMRQASGGGAQVIAKLLQLRKIFAAHGDADAISRRLKRLTQQNVIDVAPTAVQLACGSIDMLRFWITPSARDYYRSKGINFAFHQLLRFLDDPASLADPLGFASDRDAIIGHLLQVVHANPQYDLQLLSSFPDGLDALEEQIEMMIARTHWRAATIAAVVEDPDYFSDLLRYMRAFRENPRAQPLLRENVRESHDLLTLERTFGSLTEAMRYMTKLPTTWRGAARHLATVRTFPSHLASESSGSHAAGHNG